MQGMGLLTVGVWVSAWHPARVKKNQRRHARVKTKAMSSRVRVGGGLHLGLGVENLSLGGAFVRCAQVPPLHSYASLELAVPGVNQPLVLAGKVAFALSTTDAAARKVPPGFAIEFVQPLPPHVQRGLERLLSELDEKALIPLAEEEDEEERTQSVPALEVGGELAALRKLVSSHEREIERLEQENAMLRAQLTRLSRR